MQVKIDLQPLAWSPEQLEQLAIFKPAAYAQASRAEQARLLKAYQTEFTDNGAIRFEAWYDGTS